MNANEIDDLLYSIPEGVSYLLEELDLEDIPRERVDKLIDIVTNCSKYEFYQVFRASGLLCHWGAKEGFIHISNLLISSYYSIIREENLDIND